MLDVGLHPKDQTAWLGDSALEDFFLQKLSENKLPHALLLTGAKGIGKATLAYRLARQILARDEVVAAPEEASGINLFGDAPQPSAPPVDKVFREISEKSHPDLRVIERLHESGAGSQIVIDDIRHIRDFLHLKGASQHRLVIIDPVDQMNANAANALLKILEEPPVGAFLILISHRPDQLLPTLLSRVQRFNLQPISYDAINQIFPNNVESEFLSEYASGSIGAFIKAQELGLHRLYQDILKMMQSYPNFSRTKIRDMAKTHGLNAAKLLAVIDLMLWWLPQIWRGENKEFTHILAKSNPQKLTEFWQELLQKRADLKTFSLDDKLVFLSIWTELEKTAK